MGVEMKKSVFKQLLKSDYSDLITVYNNRSLFTKLLDEFDWFLPITEDALVKRTHRSFWRRIRTGVKFNYHFQGGELWKKDLIQALSELEENEYS